MSSIRTLSKYFFATLLGMMLALNLLALPTFAAGKGTDLVPNTCPKGVCPVIGDPSKAVGNADENTISNFILSVARFGTFIGVSLAVLFMVYGGILYVTDDGSGSRAENGKKILVNATIGLIVIIVAYTIVAVITGLLQGDIGSSFFG